MKLALVYDKVTKFGGAERVLLALHELWPNASLYTTIYNPKTAKWADDFKVIPSFGQNIPVVGRSEELLLPFLGSMFVESFNFDDYDVVISVTSDYGKAIITRPQTFHICYCLTPTRYLWSGFAQYLSEPGFGIYNSLVKFIMKCYFPKLRQKDFIIAKRPDLYLTVSQTVKYRVKKIYRQDSSILYPPVDLSIFSQQPTLDTESPSDISSEDQDFFLIVSRLVPFKRIDYAISAFNKLGWKLTIIGTGIDEKRLKNMAKKNIKFLKDQLTDEKLACYYRKCQALILPGEEDFGLTAIEAQACGKPVVAFAHGGSVETVINGVTGELYQEQKEEALMDTLNKFNNKKYLASVCRDNAKRFSKEIFKSKIKRIVEEYSRMFRRRMMGGEPFLLDS